MSEVRVVRTEAAPAPFQGAPYSQALVVGELVFVSGQTPLDPATSQLVEGDVTVQTQRILQNIGAILEEAGSGLDRVLKTTVFLTDLGDFAAMNAAYAAAIGEPRPARSTVQVSALPGGAIVEIECIALVRG